MTHTATLLPYQSRRALEDAAFTRHITPFRVTTTLLPVWQIEIKSKVTEGEDYDLIDKYLERAIGEAGIDSQDELARFLSLDHELVGQALTFLRAIGHVAMHQDRYQLTPLGSQSLRDGKRYRVSVEDRRKLYFDGFESTPLPHRYYQPDKVVFLDGDDTSRTADYMVPLNPPMPFRPTAVAELSGYLDREKYGLPHSIAEPEILRTEPVFTAGYIVKGIDRDGNRVDLVYTGASEAPDSHFGPLWQRHYQAYPALNHFYNKARHNATDQQRIIERLRDKGLPGVTPTGTEEGAWKVSVPAAALDGLNNGAWDDTIGTYSTVRGGTCVLVTCDDPTVREIMLLRQLQRVLGSQRHIKGELLQTLLRRLGDRFDLPVDIATLRQHALRENYPGLAAQLEELN